MRIRASRFDLLVWSVIGVLFVGVVGLIIIGDDQPTQNETLRIAFLQTDDDDITNLFAINPATPDSPVQLTFTTMTIHDFGVSADGRYIAYAERMAQAQNRNAEIFLLDLRTGDRRQLTNCVQEDADCTTPVFSPDGNTIAYQRVELNSALNVGVSPNRVWLLRLNTNPISNIPLISDSQVIGYSPVWSPDGEKIAFYDSSQSGIVIYDFVANANTDAPTFDFIASRYGSVGEFSPDSTQMIFPEIQTENALVRATIQLAELDSGTFVTISDENPEVDDQNATWHPSGDSLLIARRYLDSERITRGHHLFLYDFATDNASPLVYDPRYIHGYFSWNPAGTMILMTRFEVMNADGETNPNATLEIWTYDMETGTLSRMVEDGFQPHWIP